ncbi:ZYRO0D05764p [Zygosaccharomyces rouxii]|uniref:Nucleotide exchange factor SIL1 n=1 Tax=Zygosaccharomyces rouxii (strain ATCC 2623 / CBS 732 / NBRC 1130 / NCYC 568 / NRRL Y-229) TaxID=559307 RepID=C5DVD3_ZYGRC|nr:uncharacterized protein ZYRO0D05764g [Zygosaccharomyces rouxii]KAH9200665.1 hypothetical protein LQ764DRAFT_97451 [Zygosaccharomyces rouxii]CAR27752.1 ZYRO0D05764p [Zygosaccharomyces rouxii]
MKLLPVAIVGLTNILPILANPIKATLSPESNTVETSSLYVGDSLVCNQEGCYPKLFEADNDWKTVKEGQVLPGGLDIRMNLETGLKEAKLSDNTAHTDTPNDANAVVPVSAPSEDTEYYEFTNDFETVDKLLQNLHSSEEVVKLENKLDDLIVFAHDYKHGSKIITHEFELLRNIALQQQLPTSIRELGVRMIVSCLRNNPKSIEYVQDTHPEFVHQVFQELENGVEVSNPAPSTIALAKRYLSVLDELLSSTYHFTKDQMLTLKKIYEIQDKQIRIKVLELISKYFGPTQQPHLNKRDIVDTAPNVSEWAQELQKWIQDDGIDEIHTRKFFNSLYNIKTQLGSDIKVDSSFINWLSHETEKRKQNVENQNQNRDLEQDSFDKRLIESRHLVFGNPMAHRVKHFNDEL